MPRPSKSQRGMSLIEVAITLTVLVVSLGGLGMMVLSTQSTAAAMRDRDIVRAQAVKYMERLLRIPYGTNADPAAQPAQLAEFFDDNAVVTGGAGLTLKSLETPVNAPGWRFRVLGLEADGVFEVEINSDLDGNGTFQGIRGAETPTFPGAVGGDGVTVTGLVSENDSNIMRIEIFWNGQSLLRTIRSAPVEGT